MLLYLDNLFSLNTMQEVCLVHKVCPPDEVIDFFLIYQILSVAPWSWDISENISGE
jgi:hypothetical protein